MKLAIYSILHMCVDGVCAFGMFRCFVSGESGYLAILVYNFCAFALQMPFGLLLDVIGGNTSAKRYCPIVDMAALCASLGVVLTLVGACTNPAILGIGNALFHVGGGVGTIREDRAGSRKGQDLGVFVAPGALGLYIGTLLGKQGAAVGVSATVCGMVVLMICLMVLLLVKSVPAMQKSAERRRKVMPYTKTPEQYTAMSALGLAAVTICCFLVVVLRSYVGMAVTFPWKTTMVMSTLAVLCVVAGKMAGGFCSARVGQHKTIWISLLCAAVCFALGSIPLFGLLALFFFHMTMPVTLYMLAEAMPKMSGFAFGLLTFGLFLGFLPIYLGSIRQYPAGALGAAGSVLSLLLLLFGEKKMIN